MSRIREHWLVFIIIGLVFLIFQQALGAQFVFWDDDVFIIKNEILRMDFLSACRVVFSTYFHGDYLPITLMSYWLDFNLFGDGPFVFHLVNLIFHSINILLVYVLILNLSEQKTMALAVSLIFAFHPLQVEPVVWISERKSLLSAMFTLSALLFYLNAEGKRAKSFLAASYLLYIASVLTKTTAILLPLIFIGIDVLKRKISLQKSILKVAPLLVVVAVVAFVRVLSYGHTTVGISEATFSFERLKQLPFMVFDIFWFYISKFFWPENLSAIYPYFMPSMAAYIKAGFGFLAIGALVAWLAKKKDSSSTLMFGFFIFCLLPVVQIIPRANYVNDRYMYLPIIGLSYLLVMRIREMRGISLAALAVVIGTVMGFASYSQSKIWLNNLFLWEDTVAKNPQNILSRNALGLEYSERGRFYEAIEQFEQVLKMDLPASLKLKSINNLANIYTHEGFKGRDMQKAIALFESAVASSEKPNLTYELRINLGQTYYHVGEQKKGKDLLRQVYQEVLTDPDSRSRWLLNYIPEALENMPDK